MLKKNTTWADNVIEAFIDNYLFGSRSKQQRK